MDSHPDIRAPKHERRLSLAQFLMFALVGATGTAVHYAILLTTVELFHRSVVLGSICGSVGGAIVNYILNYRFTFKSEKKFIQAAPRFALIALSGLLLNAALVYVFVRHFSIGYLWIQIFVTLIILLFNYVLNALWTFRKTSARLSSPDSP